VGSPSFSPGWISNTGVFSHGNYLLSDAAHQEIMQTSATMSAHDNQIGTEFVNMIYYTTGNVADLCRVDVLFYRKPEK